MDPSFTFRRAMMYRFYQVSCLVGVLLVASGCIEQSVVVKVNPDRSAVIHVRSFAEKPVLFVSAPDSDESKKRIPTLDTANEIAAKLGPGVVVKEIRESTGVSGWSGFEVIFECKDINAIELDTKLLTSMKLKDKNAPTRNSKQPDPRGLIKFNYDGDELQIRNQSQQSSGKDRPSETRDPFGKSASIPAVPGIGTAIAESLVKRIRVGVFVEVVGQIESTNARHVDNGMIALLSLDGPQLESTTISKLLALEQDSPDFVIKTHQLDDESKGLKMDLQPLIRVQLAK